MSSYDPLAYDPYRALWLISYLADGMPTIDNIAEELGCSVPTAKRALADARHMGADIKWNAFQGGYQVEIEPDALERARSWLKYMREGING